MAMVAKTLRAAAEHISGGHTQVSIDVGENRTLTITVADDSDSTPMDADCYTPEDIERWRNDDWSYCGLIVTLGTLESSLWGIERGFKSDEVEWFKGHLQDLASELVTQLQSEARLHETSSRLVAALVKEDSTS